MKDVTSGVIKKSIEELFEEINRLDDDLKTYTPKRMLDWWISHPNHRFHIYHPAVNELALLLDKELLIGIPSPQNYLEDFSNGIRSYVMTTWKFGDLV